MKKSRTTSEVVKLVEKSLAAQYCQGSFHLLPSVVGGGRGRCVLVRIERREEANRVDSVLAYVKKASTGFVKERSLSEVATLV